ncbi:conserved hypothetical protein [Histoplasma capsulatum var. duboisii H88]|uniref:Uncharacterized protein n=1 Tax=Ajellomyces capsulatus (strain H88) TaxID=544711 RepID=F0UH48_AJEC8|nr:conserved hypothetical protein [Histoplasma capsulatum var. duboisii H88]
MFSLTDLSAADLDYFSSHIILTVHNADAFAINNNDADQSYEKFI